MNTYTPGGYSWLCVAPEPKKDLFAEKKKSKIAHLTMGLEKALQSLEQNMHDFHVTANRPLEEDETIEKLKRLKKQCTHNSVVLLHFLDEIISSIQGK